MRDAILVCVRLRCASDGPTVLSPALLHVQSFMKKTPLSYEYDLVWQDIPWKKPGTNRITFAGYRAQHFVVFLTHRSFVQPRSSVEVSEQMLPGILIEGLGYRGQLSLLQIAQGSHRVPGNKQVCPFSTSR